MAGAFREKAINLFNCKKAQNFALIVLGLVILVFLVQTYGKACREYGYDFSSYLLSAKALVHGQNPYLTETVFPYIYPLFLAFVLIPFTFIPYWLAVLAWFALNAFCLGATAVLTVSLARERLNTAWRRNLLVPLTALFIALVSVIQNNFLNGQVNFVVIFLCLLFLKKYLAGKKTAACFFLAVAISVKLVPLVLLFFLLVREDFKSILLTLAFTTFCCLLPVVFLGNQLFFLYHDYITSFVYAAFQTTPSPGEGNIYFSFHEFCARLVPGLDQNLWWRAVSLSAVIGPFACLDLWSRRKKTKGLETWALSFYLLVILLIAPVSEKHHLAFVFPAVILVILRFLFEKTRLNYRNLLLLPLFLGLYFCARIDPGGPFYFFSILLLGIMTAMPLLEKTSFNKTGFQQKMNDYDPPLTNCPFCASDMLVFFDEDFRGNKISRCLDCQVKFMNPRYSDEYLCDFYSKYITVGKSQEELEDLWKEALTAGHNFYLSLVERYVPAGKMLSVGCGSGVELEAARSRNWKVEGYDVDEATVAGLRDKLGINISCGDFLDSGYRGETYDCCYLHHVLEHLKNPQDYLGKIQSILKPGGVLFLACPNVVSLSNSFKTFLGKVNLKKNRGKHYDTNHHLFYFSPWVLKRILERFFAFSVLLIRNGHHVRPSQSRLKRFLMRNFTEIFPWKSSFVLIARKN